MFPITEEQSFETIFFHCASSCCYSLAIFIFLLLSDQKCSLGKLSSLPIAGIFLFLEFAKYFTSRYVLPIPDETLGRRDERGPSNLKKQSLKTRVKDIFKCVLYFGIAVFAFFVTFIIFGAEIFSKHEETLMLSVLLTVLTLGHTYINLGSQGVVNIVSGLRPYSTAGKMVYRNIIGAIVGTWFGAFFIPLDWDRQWQEWPITCALGGICGFGVSNLVSASLGLYQHSKRDKLGRKLL